MIGYRTRRGKSRLIHADISMAQPPRNNRIRAYGRPEIGRSIRSRFEPLVWSDGEMWMNGRSVAAPPMGSAVELLGNIEGVIEFDAEVSDGAFQLGMSEQQLDRARIAGLAIDQGCLGATQGARPVG